MNPDTNPASPASSMNALPRGAVAALQQILINAGLPVERDPDNFGDTALRWLTFLGEFRINYDPLNDLGTTFPLKDDSAEPDFRSMVVQANIPYRAICAHHLLPVVGHAHIGYIPSKRVVGLSKLARLVWGITHEMPSLQEVVGDKIVDALVHYLHLNGVDSGAMCVISARHGCMECRGVAESDVLTNTASVRGAFRTKPEARDEFYKLVQMSAH